MIDRVVDVAKRIPPWAVDVAIAVVLGGAIVTAIGLAPEDARTPDVWAYLLGLSIAALALFRRRWPLPVLLASFVLLQAYYVANYPMGDRFEFELRGLTPVKGKGEMETYFLRGRRASPT